jgi:hypothetical protein
MKIEKEDIVFGALALLSLIIWYFSLLMFDNPLVSIIFLWTVVIILSIVYIYVYKRRGRNMKILRLRFFISAIPIYPLMIYYIYKLVIDHNLPAEQRFLPFFILLPALILNGSVLYLYELRKQK